MKKSIRSTRAIVETGLMAAIIVVFMIIRAYIPLVGIIAFFILPIPVTLLYVRYGLKYALGALAVSAIIAVIVINPIMAVILLVSFGLTGLVLGYCITNNRKASTAIILLSLAFMLTTVIDAQLTLTFITKMKFVDAIKQSIKQSINMTQTYISSSMDYYRAMGMSKEQLDIITSRYKSLTVESTLKSLFVVMVIFSVMVSYLNYVITKLLLKRFGIKVNEIVSFTRIYIPTIFSALMILAIGIGMFLSSRKVTVGEYIINSSYIIFSLILVIVGAATAAYFLINRYKMKKGVVVSIITLVLFILPTVLLYLGVAETIFDFRKIDPNRPRRKLED